MSDQNQRSNRYGRQGDPYGNDPYGGDLYQDSYGDSYYDDYQNDYVDVSEEDLRREEQRLARERRKKAEQRRARREQRERELRRARTLTAVMIVVAVAAVVGIVFGVHYASTHFSSGSSTVASATTATTETATESTTESSSAATTSEVVEGDISTYTAEKIAEDRAAKNYSSEIATFWPYYEFLETENTVTIPTVPGFEEQYAASFGTEFGTTTSAETASEAVSADTEVVASSEEAASMVTTEATTAASADASTESSTDTTTVSTEETTVTEAEAESTETADTSSSTSTVNADGSITSKDGTVVPASAVVGGDYVGSKYAMIVNADTGEIIAEKNPYERIVPASMTKVMTILVAAEHLESEDSLQDVVTLTQEDEDYAYTNGSSAVCWMPGDTATVEDLFYGTILPSGADAAVALAEYIAGDMDSFVDLMNEKAEELGISDTTHFMNPVGVYDENHYSTCYDIAVIMKAALENDWCRQVLAQHTWTTSPTSQHPEGITVSNWFLRRIEDLDNNGTVQCAKTGFVNESGSCAVSYQVSNGGGHYIAVTANATSGWRCIYDHSALYREYTQ